MCWFGWVALSHGSSDVTWRFQGQTDTATRWGDGFWGAACVSRINLDRDWTDCGMLKTYLIWSGKQHHPHIGQDVEL